MSAFTKLAIFLIASCTFARASDVDFVRDIRPILSENCSFCHGPDEAQRQADLRLDTSAGAWSTLEKNNAAESELFRRITSDDPDAKMPPDDSNRSLTPGQIELIRKWIDQGADWEHHWAFRPVDPTEVPADVHPIDLLVHRELDARGIEPAAAASKATLIRRLTLDLTGFPPTPREVESFLTNSQPDAYGRLVDRLLESPAYGQRMAWNWLDAARYADTNGYQGDNERTMWPWRDWVVKAFNDNMPYDQFTIWQLAGDLLPNATDQQTLATAFLRNQMINGEGGRIAEENRVEYVMEMTETVGTIWLGLTLNCCRCHDHKYDPITNEEYYKLFAIFNQTPIDGGGGDPRTKPVMAVPNDEQVTQLAELDEQLEQANAALSQIEDSLRSEQSDWEASELASLTETEDSDETEQLLIAAIQAGLDDRTDEQKIRVAQAHRSSNPQYVKQLQERDNLAKKRAEVDAGVPKVMVMADQEQTRKTFVLTRGLYNQPTDEVTPGFPACLPTDSVADQRINRLSLARWLVADENPLTARVTVNRFWQQIFGVGLVKTTEDFGTQGETPEYAELLDTLADDFRTSGWDVKNLVRTIVTSAAYRQSSKVSSPEIYERDPNNRLLARGSRYRMPAWMLRDQALAASGLLSSVASGPSINTYQPPNVWEDASFGKKKYKRDSGEKLYRRSLYVYWRRIIAPPMFFDNAKRQVCEVKLNRTNTPLQALQLLNNETYVEAARALAQLVLVSDATSDAERIHGVMQRLVARDANNDEMRVLQSGLSRTRKQFNAQREEAMKLLAVGESPRDESLDAIEHAAWTSLCLAVLNLDETLTRE